MLAGVRSRPHRRQKTQRALRRNGRVKLAHRACGRIARVDEGLFPLCTGCNALPLALIECFKIVTPHIHLTPDLEHVRQRHPLRTGINPERYLSNRADVLGDVFTGLAIAASRCLDQHTAFVAQVHGKPIELEFCHVFHCRRVLGPFQFTAHASIKIFCAAGFGIGLGANAQHGHGMAYRLELVECFSANALGRRIGRNQFGMPGLQSLQFPK